MLTVLKTSENKSYNKCITCEALGVSCDGPNLTAVSTERFCEWCRLRKEHLGWSNAKLIEISGVSKSTVDRVIAGTAQGIYGETKSRIACALIYGVSSDGNAWGQHPCAMAAGEGNLSAEQYRQELDALKEQYEKRIAELTENDRGKIDFLKQQVEFNENQMKEKDILLKERGDFLRAKDRIIALLASLLGLSVFVIVIALLIDMMNPSVGFFWRETLAAMIP